MHSASDPYYDCFRVPPTSNMSFEPDPGLMDPFCLSVRPSGGTITLFKLNQSTLNFLHIFWKPSQELSSKMGKIGIKKCRVMGT
jgi:hypothetical protein